MGQFRYMLRSGMMGWVSLMLDTTAWSVEQREAAQASIALYKEKLRPLIRDARLYHVSERPDGVHWDGVEYWDADRGQGVVYAFRGSEPNQDEHRFLLAGLDRRKSYRLHFEDGSSNDLEATGDGLMREGLRVRLGEPLSSELVFLSEAAKSQAAKQD
jgi:alpha-galactosidase